MENEKRFLKKINTLEEYMTYKDSTLESVHVVFLKDTKRVIYVNYANDYFTIEALEDGLTVSLSQNASEYRIDDGNWTTLPSGTTTPEINRGQKISFKMTNPTILSGYGMGRFTVNNAFNVSGNIMSLLYGDNFEGQTDLTGKDYAFAQLFYNCTTLKNAENLILPATTLAYSCYSNMFNGCTSLTTVPVLPATTLADNCYHSMFKGCKSLTEAPELPSTTLAYQCYYSMFNGCNSLTTAPELPATTLAYYCYSGMFEGCTNLTSAPVLPATTLTDGCYSNMFYNCTSLTETPQLPATTLTKWCYAGMFTDCTSLTTAPQLPATTLASYCYNSMFYGCTNLTTAPKLPATTLANYCYSKMFFDCTSLTTAPALPATTLAESCYRSMFDGCTNLTTAPALPATTLASYCYNSMFNGCTSLVEAPQLPATTLTDYCYSGMFWGCTSLTTAPELPATTLTNYCYQNMFIGCRNLNYIEMLATNVEATSCLSYWVNGVASSGTFVKAENIYLPTGSSGIPDGWTVNEDETIVDYSKVYFTIKSLEDGLTVKLSRNASEYRIDNGEWISLGANTATPEINRGHKISFKLYRATNNSSSIGTFTISKKCSVSGNIMSLLYGDNFEGQNNLTGMNNVFAYLFQDCTTIQNAKSLILPATTLASSCYSRMFRNCTSLITTPELPATTVMNNCYSYMFQGCTNLTTAPQLPATTLAGQCYSNMFNGCTNLTTAPDLPATTLASNCYSNMFAGCISLTTAPQLPATTLAGGCYLSMFYGCVSLTEAPDLPATTLAGSCYIYMFAGCISLTTAPQLPATTLAGGCYQDMFDGCTSLTSAPELPATTLADNCYQYMFQGCTSLTEAPVLPATKLATYCYGYMFDGCTSLTSAPELPATTLEGYCYYGMFQGCSSLTEAPALPATTLISACYGYMFKDCSKLNNITMLATNIKAEYALENWTKNVASKGTFTKAEYVVLPTGIHGVPSGWTVDEIDLIYDYSKEYFTIRALEDGLTASLSLNASEYRIDDGNWTALPSGTTTPEINRGQKISFKITNPTGSNIGMLIVNKAFNAEGNIMSLLYGDDFEGQTDLTGKNTTFGSLFYYRLTLQSAKNLILPAITLTNNCYYNMFSNCTSLTEAPELPATTLAYGCYEGMFYNCYSLREAPELPATTLANRCYYQMFRGCYGLTTAPELPATTLANSCYYGMFRACSKLEHIEMLATDISAGDCLYDWVYGVASEGTFVKNPDMASLPTATSSNSYKGIPDGWTVTDYIDYSKEYFAIEALEDGLTVQLSRNASEYRIDNGDWATLSSSHSTPSINSGQKISFKITNPTMYSDTGVAIFSVNKAFNVEGNIMSLLYGDNFEGQTDLTGKNYVFSYLFQMCTTLQSAKNLILPATTLADYCYHRMFQGCTNLTEAPQLPATTLANGCYAYMFGGSNALPDCSNIDFTSESVVASGGLKELFANTKVTDDDLKRILPKNNKGKYCLPCTILTEYCYEDMFYNCTSLTEAPELPSTMLADYCYHRMFYNCTSLTTAPSVLPATTLADSCCYYMFRGCTSLTSAPKLPATTLANGCYHMMFHGCTSLTTAPVLPAITLTRWCYRNMFYGCNKLNYIKMLATDISASNCLVNWVRGAASSGTFVKHKDMTTLPSGYNGIPTGWTVVNA